MFGLPLAINGTATVTLLPYLLLQTWATSFCLHHFTYFYPLWGGSLSRIDCHTHLHSPPSAKRINMHIWLECVSLSTAQDFPTIIIWWPHTLLFFIQLAITSILIDLDSISIESDLIIVDQPGRNIIDQFAFACSTEIQYFGYEYDWIFKDQILRLYGG